MATIFAAWLWIAALATLGTAAAAPVDPPPDEAAAPQEVMPDIPGIDAGETPSASGPIEDTEMPNESAPVDDVVAPDDSSSEDAERVAPDPTAPLPTVEYDPARLPTPVRRLREQIIEAASTGDPENLRPIIEANGEPPDFSFNAVDDPIAYLKSLSGDPEGREILAILIEVLEAGYVRTNPGQPDELYVWPYFARYPIDRLTPRQLVELFKIVFAGDYEDMQTFGAYFAYRVGIGPEGRWRFFLVGD